MIYHDILYNNDKHELSKKHMRHLPQLVQQLRIGRKKTSSWRDPMIAPGSPKKMGIENGEIMINHVLRPGSP